jgi:hypothetical protein
MKFCEYDPLKTRNRKIRSQETGYPVTRNRISSHHEPEIDKTKEKPEITGFLLERFFCRRRHNLPLDLGVSM